MSDTIAIHHDTAQDLAAETVSALARLVVAAALPTLQAELDKSEAVYNRTFQSHLEIMQSLGRRIDNVRELLGDQREELDGVAADLGGEIMIARLFQNKVNRLDGTSAGHQNHIAGLYDLVGELQEALTVAEAAISDLENPAPIAPPPEPQYDPFTGILQGYTVAGQQAAAKFGKNWLKDWSDQLATYRPSDRPSRTHEKPLYTPLFPATEIPSSVFKPGILVSSGKITSGDTLPDCPMLASSDYRPLSCEDRGFPCCDHPICCVCGKVKK